MRIAAWAVLPLLLLACNAAAQENRLDIAISGSAVLSKTTSSSSGAITDKPTKSAAYTGTFRYHFKPKHALDINIGHTSNSQLFFIAPDTYRVLTGITEFSADYVFGPFSAGKIHPFLFAGAGGLHFSAGNTFIDTFPAQIPVASQNALAFLYGGGVDYPVWRLISLRLQYRGLFFREPDFKVPALFFTGSRGHLAEPSAGIVLRF